MSWFWHNTVYGAVIVAGLCGGGLLIHAVSTLEPPPKPQTFVATIEEVRTVPECPTSGSVTACKVWAKLEDGRMLQFFGMNCAAELALFRRGDQIPVVYEWDYDSMIFVWRGSQARFLGTLTESDFVKTEK